MSGIFRAALAAAAWVSYVLGNDRLKELSKKLGIWRDLSISATVALTAMAGAAWFLGLANLSESGRVANRGLELKSDRVLPTTSKQKAAIDAVYDALNTMNIDGLYKLEAFSDLCKTPAPVDCKGLTRDTVFTLIDGVLKQRDEDRQAATAEKSAYIALSGVGVSFFSLTVSILAYLRK